MEGMRAPFQGRLNVLVAIPTRTYKHKQNGPRSTRIYVRGLAFKPNRKIGFSKSGVGFSKEAF